MLDEVVHIRRTNHSASSFCGEQLVKSTFDPFLFTTKYDPAHSVYCVYRVVTVGTSFPVYEQVGIFNRPCFCDDCLASIGLLLLKDFGQTSIAFL